MMALDRILSVPEAAALVRDLTGMGCPATLNRWAATGHGPPRLKIGPGPRARVGYRRSAVIAWVEKLGAGPAPVGPAPTAGGGDVNSVR